MSGFIRDEDINEVRERNNIVEVISEYLPLKKAGRSLRALCPFHHEKTPSFMVDPAKQLYHCFGCGEGGSVFTFVMKMDKLDFPESVKSLAERVGYALHFETSERAQKRISLTNRLYEANKEAAQFYQRFFQGDGGQEAREYLKSRGFEEDTIQHFKVGLAPAGWDNVLKFLCQKGFKPEELAQGGLVIQGEDKSFYDRFRSRIIFPIPDLKGRVIAFGGRVIAFGGRALNHPVPGRTEPKYMNSPETPLYHKSSILYGLFQAKTEMARREEALVVEGYTDVLALYQGGLKNAVATMGTAFTSEHLRLLARFAPRVKLVFDADKAGEQAAERGLDLLGESKVEIQVVSLPSGEDPADFVTKKGKDSLEKVLEKGKPLIDFCLNQAVSKYDLRDPQARVKASFEALPIIAALKSAVAQEEYVKKLAEKLNVSLETLVVELKKLKNPREKEALKISSPPILDAQLKAEKEVLRLALHFPEEAKFLKELDEDHFTLPDYRELFSILKSQLLQGKFETDKLLGIIGSERLQKAISRLMFEHILVPDREKYIKDILTQLKVAKIERQVKKLKVELEQLDPDADPPRHDFLFKELLTLEADKRGLKA